MVLTIFLVWVASKRLSSVCVTVLPGVYLGIWGPMGVRRMVEVGGHDVVGIR